MTTKISINTIIKAKNGDEKSMLEIIKKFKLTIESLITRLNMRDLLINCCQLEDARSEGNIAILEAINSFNLEQKVTTLHTWVYANIRCRLLDMINGVNRNGSLYSSAVLQHQKEINNQVEKTISKSRYPNIFTFIEKTEDKLSLKRKIMSSSLTPKEKTVMLLLLQGLSQAEIGRKTSIKGGRGAVKVYMKSGMKKLKN